MRGRAQALLAVPLLLILTLWKTSGTIEEPLRPVRGLPAARTVERPVPWRIRVAALRLGADPDLAICIARLESGFRNVPNLSGESSAYGVFQFLDSTWRKTVHRMGKDWTLADKRDVDKNIEAGVWLLAHDGPGHWVVAPHCTDG